MQSFPSKMSLLLFVEQWKKLLREWKVPQSISKLSILQYGVGIVSMPVSQKVV